MEEFLSHVFDIALSPFTSQSLLVIIPLGFSYIMGCVGIVISLIRRI